MWGPRRLLGQSLALGWRSTCAAQDLGNPTSVTCVSICNDVGMPPTLSPFPASPSAYGVKM